MTIAFNRMPTYTEALTTRGAITRGWYTYWSGLLQGQPTSAVAVEVVGTTPFTFVAPIGGTVILNGGTTTQVQFSRDGQNFYVTGQTSGMFPLSKGDQLVIAYSLGPPTMTFVPR